MIPLREARSSSSSSVFRFHSHIDLGSLGRLRLYHFDLDARSLSPASISNLSFKMKINGQSRVGNRYFGTRIV